MLAMLAMTDAQGARGGAFRIVYTLPTEGFAKAFDRMARALASL